MPRLSCLAIVLATGLAAGAAHATVIDTYSFTQGGYFGIGGPGVLSGSFTGAVEANGFIELADLSSIAVSFTTAYSTTSGTGPARLFSFDTSQGAGSLDFVTPIGRGLVCTGAAAALGASGCIGNGWNGSIGLEWTPDLATVTLVSSVVETPAPPRRRPDPVPEPASLALFGTALAGLGIALSARRSRAAI